MMSERALGWVGGGAFHFGVEAFTSMDPKLFHQQMDDSSLIAIVLFPRARNGAGTKEVLTGC